MHDAAARTQRLIELIDSLKRDMDDEKKHVTIQEHSCSTDYLTESDNSGVIDIATNVSQFRSDVLSNLLNKTTSAIASLQEELFFASLHHTPAPSLQKKRFVLYSLCASKLPGGDDWILTRIINHEPAKGVVQVRDDDDADKKLYLLREDQVIPLVLASAIKSHCDSFNKYEHALALFPGTTAFYPGFVIDINYASDTFSIQFDGDEEDEDGKIVPRDIPPMFVIKKDKFPLDS